MNKSHIKKQLLDLKNELDALEKTSREAADTVELDQSRVGRLTRMDALQAQAMSTESRRRRLALRQRIEPALQRLAAGDYGICMDCDDSIPDARLQHDPTCFLCVTCASRREQK